MQSDWIRVDDKCRRRHVALGAQIHHVIVEFQAGGVGATHAHPHEQTTYVLSGRCRYHVNGVERELGPGDVIVVPGDAQHGMTATEATVLFDTFTPPREDMLTRDGVRRPIGP
jgi:quercetin dioxygenase-like cupin family protein